MDNLRWILIAVGGVALLAVYLLHRRRVERPFESMQLDDNQDVVLFDDDSAQHLTAGDSVGAPRVVGSIEGGDDVTVLSNLNRDVETINRVLGEEPMVDPSASDNPAGRYEPII